MYNSEKLRLDILRAKHEHVQEAFIRSYDRFRLAQRKVLQMQTELTETDKELANSEAETLATGAACRESKKEVTEAVISFKETVEKMEDELEKVKGTL